MRSAQNAVCVIQSKVLCHLFGRYHLQLLRGGGGKTTILSLWFREAVDYQYTIQHPNMPSAEFPFGIYIQGKEFQSKKPLFCSPSPKKGNLKALLQNWPIGGLEPDTFV